MGELLRGSVRRRSESRRLRLPRLKLDPASGWLSGVRRRPSPNCDDRPAGIQPDLIVIHGISLPPGRFGGPYVDQLFTNTLPMDAHPYFRGIAGLKVSSHLLIRRDGEVVQYVPVHRRAWHAGQSRYRERAHCNDFSVGIELEGADTTPYAPVQYQRLCATIRALRRGLPSLARAPIVGHSDIAPGRKTDPGPAFDWRPLGPVLGSGWRRIARGAGPRRR